RERRGQFLADHPQRQELVPLQAQNRLQAVDVVLGEEAVAALRALRRHESFALEVADLRDRDVREFGLEVLAHRADRQQAFVVSGLSAKVSPARPPPERTTSAGPLIPKSSSSRCPSSSVSSGTNAMVASLLSSRTSKAPHFEQ